MGFHSLAIFSHFMSCIQLKFRSKQKCMEFLLDFKWVAIALKRSFQNACFHWPNACDTKPKKWHHFVSLSWCLTNVCRHSALMGRFFFLLSHTHSRVMIKCTTLEICLMQAKTNIELILNGNSKQQYFHLLACLQVARRHSLWMMSTEFPFNVAKSILDAVLSVNWSSRCTASMIRKRGNSTEIVSVLH